MVSSRLHGLLLTMRRTPYLAVADKNFVQLHGGFVETLSPFRRVWPQT
jgi:hypothetical protein